MALPRRVNVVSWNMWLIPTYGAWNLGRIDRCRDRVAGETAKLLAAAPCDLSIVALQEAWTFRIGLFYPLIWLLARLETWLLKVGGYGGAAEPAWWHIIITAVTICTQTQSFVPGARRLLWCPKGRFVDALAPLGFTWRGDGVAAFAAAPLSARPPLLIDSGLLLCASRAPDASGFAAYDRVGPEARAHKGLLWAAFGSLGVVATHMAFHFEDGGANRRRQRRKLAACVAELLGLEASAKPTCDAVLLVGDFNHALPSQTTGGAAAEEPKNFSRSTYVRPWLPAIASLDLLLRDLALGGRARVARLSPDAPTNLDGTVDHVFAVTRVGAAATYAARTAATVPDPAGDASDHLMVACALDLASG